MTHQMIGAHTEWSLSFPERAIRPEDVERAAEQIMDALMDIEAESDGLINSGSVGATLSQARVEIDFCVVARDVDEADSIVRDTLHELIAGRSGHIDNSAAIKETRRELVSA